MGGIFPGRHREVLYRVRKLSTDFVHWRETMAERTLGDFLKQEQQKRNLTWEEIAEELGVSVMTIHRWRKGERFPRERDWSALIEFCGPEIGPYLIEQGRERHEAYTIKRQHKREAVSSSQDDTPFESVPEVVSPARSAPPV